MNTRPIRRALGTLATAATFLTASTLAPSPASADPPISSAAPGIDAFYTPPSPLSLGNPGDLIRVEKTTVSLLTVGGETFEGEGIPQVLSWLSARFAGLPAPSDC